MFNRISEERKVAHFKTDVKRMNFNTFVQHIFSILSPINTHNVPSIPQYVIKQP